MALSAFAGWQWAVVFTARKMNREIAAMAAGTRRDSERLARMLREPIVVEPLRQPLAHGATCVCLACQPEGEIAKRFANPPTGPRRRV